MRLEGEGECWPNYSVARWWSYNNWVSFPVHAWCTLYDVLYVHACMVYVQCAWCMGTWRIMYVHACMVHWCMVNVHCVCAWCIVHGAWVHGVWLMCMVHERTDGPCARQFSRPDSVCPQY